MKMLFISFLMCKIYAVRTSKSLQNLFRNLNFQILKEAKVNNLAQF